MADTQGVHYHNLPAGYMYFRPVWMLVKATFSASGATVTVTTSERESHVGATITGASGDYDVAGLLKCNSYHVVGCNLLCADGTVEPSIATVQANSLDATNGTLTFQVRGSTAGAETAPVDNTVVHLTILCETGAY